MTVSAFPLLAQAETAFRAGNYDQAAGFAMRHLRTHAEEPRGLSLLGAVAGATGALHQSEMFLRRAMQRQGSAETLHRLATVLAQQEKLPEALAAFQSLRSDSDPRVEVKVALLLDKLGRHDEARETLRRSVERHPAWALGWVSYGQHLRGAGSTDEAVQAFRRALELEPALGEAWWGIASIKRRLFTPEDTAAMEAAAAGGGDTDNLALVHFALGRAYHAEGNHERAFHHFAEANAILARSLDYDAGQLAREVEESERLFTADFLRHGEGAGDPSPAPIFIVSLPRSGSTLLEQMLGSHPEIEPLGELPHIPALLRTLMEGATRAGIRSVPEAIVRMSPADREGMGREYLRRAAAHRRTDRPYFVDKMPHNWSNAVLLRQILPNARIIDIRRDAMTCCWSNFSHSFSRAHASSFTLEGIGRAYVDYLRLMAHLDGIAPGWIKHVAYEELIERPEPVLRGLFDELGISFDENMLRFYESKRQVRTPSAEQVRRPLNREGVGTWKPYEQWLGPLKDALGELAN